MNPTKEWPTFYVGRCWDAPFTDGATAVPEQILKVYAEGASLGECDFCKEPMLPTDDLMLQPHLICHLECELRSMLGDVQHLEGRCTCFGQEEQRLSSDDHETYRESAKATLQWLLDNQQGRFRT